jgi:hypothetical protein
MNYKINYNKNLSWHKGAKALSRNGEKEQIDFYRCAVVPLRHCAFLISNVAIRNIWLSLHSN